MLDQKQLNWSIFGYWVPESLNAELPNLLTFDAIEKMYEQGYYMCDFNEARIYLFKFLELRLLYELHGTNFPGSINGLVVCENKESKKKK